MKKKQKQKQKQSHGRNITGLQSVVTSYLGLFFLIIFLFKKSQTMCIMGLINGRLIEVLIPDSILQ